MDAEMAREMMKKISHLRGNETVPTEDVIDIAMVVEYILERIDGPAHDHNQKDCWAAGNDGHYECTPPEGYGLNDRKR